MTATAVAADVAQAGDVALNRPPQTALDHVIAIQDGSNPGHVVVAELLCFPLRIDAGLIADADGQRRPDSLQITQGNMGRLIRRDVNALNTGHAQFSCLALPLLMT